VRDRTDAALALLFEHRVVMAAVARRSPADFRTLPILWSEHRHALSEAFCVEGGLAPSLEGELAELLSPRMERVVTALRRRIARTRRELPLARIREMDAACLRVNSRLPGRTLLEKAGPRGTLRGVVRVERFDTSENRVLKATSSRLQRRTRELLKEVSEAHRRSPDARSLRALLRASTTVVERPELEGLGPPRAGERPSNALLGDADYRAVWRALKLLRREELRFATDWGTLDLLWFEIVVAAAWDLLERRGYEPLPGWTRVSDAVDQPGRLRDSGPRGWVALGPDRGHLIRLAPEPDEERIRLTVQSVDNDGTMEEHVGVWNTRLEDSSGPGVIGLRLEHGAPPLARRRAIALLEEAFGPYLPVGEGGESSALPPATGRVGLSWLNRDLYRADDAGCAAVGPSAIAEIQTEVGEAPLVLASRLATWAGEVAGPTVLTGERALSAATLVKRHGGRDETAVVVPDGTDEVALAGLRPPGFETWAVWAPVAAALAAAERYDSEIPRPQEGETVSLMVALDTDATQETVRLELRGERVGGGVERLWVRLPGTAISAPGAEGRAAPATGAAWLRSGWGRPGWRLDDVLSPTEAVSRPGPANMDIRPLLNAPGAAPVVGVVVVGDASDSLLERSHDLPWWQLDAADLAMGARCFLDRKAAGLPTWVERLPKLELETAGHTRGRVPIVPPGLEVRPGQLVEHEPELRFSLPIGRDRVDFPLLRDDRPTPMTVRLEGPPLPLRVPASVRISVRFRHGLDGVSGRLVSDDPTVFSSVRFELAAGVASTEDTPVGPRRWPSPPPPSSSDIEAMEDAIRGLDRALDRLDRKLSKRIAAGDAGASEPLAEALQTLEAAFRRLEGPPESLAPSLELAPIAHRLDWLLGVRRIKKAGRAPALRRLRKLAVQTERARGAIRHPTAEFVDYLVREGLQRAPHRLEALGRTVRTAGDPAWGALLDAEPLRPSELADWGAAIERAVTSIPGFAGACAPGTGEGLLLRAVDRLESMVDGPEDSVRKRRRDIYWLLRLVTACTLFRAPGVLQPDSADVRDAVRRLSPLMDLPEDVRAYGERGAVSSNDEAIRIALDYLRGQYRSLARSRER